MKTTKIFAIALAVLAMTSCSKEEFNTQPTTSLSPSTIFATTTTSYMAVNGICRHMYQYLGSHGNAGQKSVDMVSDLMGEDLFPNARGYGWYVSDYDYTGLRNEQADRPHYIWSYFYDLVSNANMILKNVPNAVGPDSEKNDLMGQAYAYRAFGFFGAAQFYCKTYVGNEAEPGVPVYTEPTTVGKARPTLAITYKQIVDDLDSAIIRLAKAPKRADKSHINLNVAKGLRARVALEMGDWTNAAKYAKEARTGFSLMNQDTYLKGFSSSENAEWMWAGTINDEQSTIYASFFSHIDPFAGGYATLGNHKLINSKLYAKIDDNDVRKQTFDPDGSITGKALCGFKFVLPGSGWAGDYCYMRAAEMYLIEAEALAHSNEAEAKKVLEALLNARGGVYDAAATGQALIEEIWLQRRIELWGEGFRILDIKRQKVALDRTGANHNSTLWGISKLNANAKEMLILIPKQELESNPLMKQNEL